MKISKGSESNLMSAVANVGPVAVAVDGASSAFRVSSTKEMPFSENCNAVMSE